MRITMGSKRKINYQREAFMLPWNLGFLGIALGVIAILMILAMGVGLPFWIPQTFFILTVGAELLVLGNAPRSSRFRRLVKSRVSRKISTKGLTTREIYASLSRDNQRRYVKLRNLRHSIATNYERLSYASQGILENHLEKVDALLKSVLSMMQQKDRFAHFATHMEEREVLRDIAQLQEGLNTDSEKVRRIRKNRLIVLQRRLERFKKGKEQLEILEEQIATIEDVVDYIHEQSLTLNNPEEITLQLNVLLSDVAETESCLEQLESVFGSDDDDLLNFSDSLGNDLSESRGRSRTGT